MSFFPVRVMLFLVVSLALWDLRSSAPITKANNYPWDPFDQFTPSVTPTINPYDWDKTTINPFDNFEPTLKPIDYDRYTVDPRDDLTVYYERKTDYTTILLAVCVTVGTVFLIFFLRCFIHKSGRSSDTTETVLHPPTAIILLPTTNDGIDQYLPETNPGWIPHIQSAVSNTHSPVDSSNPHNSNDKPPSYFDAVTCGGQNAYPEVHRSINLNEPPPDYAVNDVMRY